MTEAALLDRLDKMASAMQLLAQALGTRLTREQLALQLAPVSALAFGALLGCAAAALGRGLVRALHHCAPGGWRLSSKSRI